MFLKIGPILASFSLFSSFQYSCHGTKIVDGWRFELRTSFVGSDRSTYWASTTAKKINCSIPIQKRHSRSAFLNPYFSQLLHWNDDEAKTRTRRFFFFLFEKRLCQYTLEHELWLNLKTQTDRLRERKTHSSSNIFLLDGNSMWPDLAKIWPLCLNIPGLGNVLSAY